MVVVVLFCNHDSISAFDVSRLSAAEHIIQGLRLCPGKSSSVQRVHLNSLLTRNFGAQFPTRIPHTNTALRLENHNIRLLSRVPDGIFPIAMAGRGETIKTGLRRAEQWRNKGKELWNVERKMKSTPPIVHLSRFLVTFFARLTAIAWLFRGIQRLIPELVRFGESLPLVLQMIFTLPNLFSKILHRIPGM